MSNDVDDEFDRMQETIDSLRAENARLNKENDDWHEASRKLREELDATTEALSHERDCSTGLADELGRSEKEAATARLALDVAQKEIERLKAAARPRNVFMECPDCSNATAKGYDIVEGAAHCRFCGHPVDADENAS